MEDSAEDPRAAWRAAAAGLRRGLADAFDALAAEAARGAADDARLDAAPPGGGWTPREVLEHVTLTDRFLLVLCDKLLDRSVRRAAEGAPYPAHPPAFAHLRRLAEGDFGWQAPAHMLPRERPPAAELARRLAADRARALALVDAAPDGLGTLHRIRMSVVTDGDDRLDLYQYLEVLRLHVARHAAQVARALAGRR